MSGQSKWLKVILTLCGIGLLVCMIAWIGPVAVWDRLKSIDLAYLSEALVAIVVGTLISAVNSYLICGASQVMTFFEYARAYWVAWAVGLVVPGQIGDVLTLNQVLRRRGMPLSQSVARTGVDKIVSLFCALLAASQIFRLGDALILRTLSWAASSLMFGLIVFLSLSLWLLHHIGRFVFRRRWIEGVVATAAEIVRIVLVHPRLLLLNLVLSILKVGLTGISYWLVLSGITGVFLSYAKVTIAAVSSGLIAYLPMSANGIGTVEIAGTGLFGSIGLGVDVVLSMYLVLRLANIVLAWIPAIFVLPSLLHHRRT
jgi:uncharacterized membrane protein YbhN (UPF0104 family)